MVGAGMRCALALTLGLAAMAATSSAAVYKVGDSAGWTILGNVNYSDWATKKTFRRGDVIEFTYPQGIHNVLEVNKADYDSCTNSSPIATHTSGDDKITIKGPGHRFFICGVPGHCAAGQKVNIRVLKQRAPAPSSAAPSAAPAASPPATAASPAGSASTPAAGATPDGSTSATTAPAPNANGAGVHSGYSTAVAVAVAAVASMAMLQ